MGPRLRRLRRDLGLTQADMAADLEISAPYVALLERNQRPMTADMLLRLARTYTIDLADLAGDGGADNTARAAVDPEGADVFGHRYPLARNQRSRGELSRHGRGVLRLYTPIARSSSRWRIVGAAIRRRIRWRRCAGCCGGIAIVSPRSTKRARALRRRWRRGQPDGVYRQAAPAAGADDAVRGDGRDGPPPRSASRAIFLDEGLDGASRAFQLALQIVYIELRGTLDAMLAEEAFASDNGRRLARRALANYAAAAILMPYGAFAKAVEAKRYDVEALGRQFGASFEQVAHRLTTLQRPGQEGVPFFFLRVDPAGNISKRLDGAGFPFAGHGGGCPLWSIHRTFRAPGEICTQWLELPDGQRFFSIARTVIGGGGSHGAPRILRAVALGCAAEHAPRLIYARDTPEHFMPVGISCGLCQRDRCAARAMPPIGRQILPDDQHRRIAPFGFADDMR
jgi:predicted transcriptional regulator/transcriptional regulator with XRE-family HTH domain